MTIAEEIAGWLPIKLFIDDPNPVCRWMYMGNKHFNEPFFDETIIACKIFEENSHLKKSLSAISLLPQWANEAKAVEPTAFIFHISRCGSTLLSQMLSLQQSNIVLSEVPFFDDLLRYSKKENSLTEILPILKAAIRLYTSRRNETYKNAFIKTDSWHIHFYKELRELYPYTPFFFLYRKPDEVLHSQQKNRGMQAIPNLIEASVFGFDKDAISTLSLDEYMALVIESYLEQFYTILQTDQNCYPINYHSGALELLNTIATKTSLTVSAADYEAMKQRAGFHAKYPNQIFSEEKKQEAMPVYLQKSFELYTKIEEIRG